MEGEECSADMHLHSRGTRSHPGEGFGPGAGSKPLFFGQQGAGFVPLREKGVPFPRRGTPRFQKRGLELTPTLV